MHIICVSFVKYKIPDFNKLYNSILNKYKMKEDIIVPLVSK